MASKTKRYTLSRNVPLYVKETTNGVKSLPGQCSERWKPIHTSLTLSAFQWPRQVEKSHWDALLVAQEWLFLKKSEKICLADSVFFEKMWTMTVSIKSPHHTLAFGEVLSDDLRIFYILTLWRYTHPGIWKVDTSSEKQMDSMKWGSFPSFRALSWQTFRAVRCPLHVKGTYFVFTYTFLFLMSFDNYLS